MKKYILNGHIPELTDDFESWARKYDDVKARTVAKTRIGEIEVSTVFLGIDYNFLGDGPPLLFETMIFDGPRDDYQERCSTWEEAEEQHAKAVKLVKDG